MSQKFCLRICSRQGDDLSLRMAIHARDLVFEVAGKAGPGATVAAKKLLVCRSLGYPDDSWRVHDAWYLRAGCWSAQAMHDLQDKVQRWREAEGRRAAAKAQTEAARRAERTRVELEAARHEHRAQLARIERQLAACETALRFPPPDQDGP